MGSTNNELCIRDENQLIVAWVAGYSEEELEEMLRLNPGWHRSTANVG